MNDCWILQPETAHLVAHGVDYDLVPIDRDGARLLKFDGTTAIDVTSIPMRGNVAACRDTEMPVTSPRWPMMSQRVYDVLCATGPMPRHRFIPSPAEAVPGGERRDDLGILHLLEHLDQLDVDRSRFTRHSRHAEALVLLPFGDSPVPAVFRLSAFSTPMFVSDLARQRLQEAGARGCEFCEPSRCM